MSNTAEQIIINGVNTQIEAIDKHVLTSKQNLIIEALAGTGKTRRLVELAVKLTARGESVIYLVFGNKASKEGQERFEAAGISADKCSTVHSFCFKALRKRLPNLKLDKGFDKKNMILEALECPFYLNNFVWDLCRFARESAYGIRPGVNLDELITKHDLVSTLFKAKDLPDHISTDDLINQGKDLAIKAIKEWS